MTKESLRMRRERALGSGAELFYDQPLEIVRGEGVYLFDADGRRYVDLYNNVPCVGHANPVVVKAMAVATTKRIRLTTSPTVRTRNTTATAVTGPRCLRTNFFRR